MYVYYRVRAMTDDKEEKELREEAIDTLERIENMSDVGCMLVSMQNPDIVRPILVYGDYLLRKDGITPKNVIDETINAVKTLKRLPPLVEAILSDVDFTIIMKNLITYVFEKVVDIKKHDNISLQCMYSVVAMFMLNNANEEIQKKLAEDMNKKMIKDLVFASVMEAMEKSKRGGDDLDEFIKP
jgi:hypothetical protein